MALPDPISSTKNPIVKRVRLVREGKEPGLIVEGVRLVEEALAANIKIEMSLVAPRLYQTERGKDLAGKLTRAGGETRDCSDNVLARASGLTTHQGVLLLAKIPTWRDQDFFRGENPFVVIAAGVRDPGNLGSLLRTAEAAGASGLFSLDGSADPHRDKAVRGSAGSVFRMPTRGGVDAATVVEICRRHKATLIAADGRRGTPLWELDFGPAPHAFILGAEADGIPNVLVEACDHLLRVPMQAPVESLNVAVAGGVVLFESRRRITSGR